MANKQPHANGIVCEVSGSGDSLHAGPFLAIVQAGILEPQTWRKSA